MKKILTKIVTGILILVIVASTAGITAPPKKAEAGGMLTFDLFATVQRVWGTLTTAATEVSTYALQYKETVLDGLAYIIAKQLLRQLTSSIVNWINTGFEGSPSFMTDPAGFLMDVGDQVTGEFIAHSGMLSKLCDGFSIDLKLALAFKYRPYSQKRYACTIGSIIKDAKSSVSNGSFISVNGFTAGDFKQGNWPAFVSLTTEPQNNGFGAYLSAQDELSYRIGTKKEEHKSELDQGHGFLSWKTCKDAPAPSGATSVAAPTAADPGSTAKPAKKPQVCETKTPGSIIFGRADDALGAPGRELELADEFNEIISALFAQLVTVVLSKGLSTASGRGPSDTNAYLNQLQNERLEADVAQFEELRRQTSASIERYVRDTESITASKLKAVNLILDVKKAYNVAKKCYQDNIDALKKPPHSMLANAQSTIADHQRKIDLITTIVQTKINPIVEEKTNEYDTARIAAQKFKKLQADTAAASTTAQMNAAATALANMISDRASLPTHAQIGQAERDVTASGDTDNPTFIDRIKPFGDEAAKFMKECQAIDVTRNGGAGPSGSN